MTAASYALAVAGEEQGPAIVTVTGEVDATNAARFAAAVGDIAAERPAVLDISDLLYLDAAGFAVLRRLVCEYRVEIALSARSPVRRAAALMGLPYHDDTRAAIAAAAR